MQCDDLIDLSAALKKFGIEISGQSRNEKEMGCIGSMRG